MGSVVKFMKKVNKLILLVLLLLFISPNVVKADACGTSYSYTKTVYASETVFPVNLAIGSCNGEYSYSIIYDKNMLEFESVKASTFYCGDKDIYDFVKVVDNNGTLSVTKTEMCPSDYGSVLIFSFKKKKEGNTVIKKTNDSYMTVTDNYSGVSFDGDKGILNFPITIKEFREVNDIQYATNDLLVYDSYGSLNCSSGHCETCEVCDECEECEECEKCEKCTECEECEKCTECEECEKCTECDECEKCTECEVCDECPTVSTSDKKSDNTSLIISISINLLLAVTLTLFFIKNRKTA